MLNFRCYESWYFESNLQCFKMSGTVALVAAYELGNL